MRIFCFWKKLNMYVLISFADFTRGKCSYIACFVDTTTCYLYFLWYSVFEGFLRVGSYVHLLILSCQWYETNSAILIRCSCIHIIHSKQIGWFGKATINHDIFPFLPMHGLTSIPSQWASIIDINSWNTYKIIYK